jgi:hypothetical protein
MLLIVPVLAGAQTAPVRGVLLERDPQVSGGEFSVRLPTHEVLRFRFDTQTTVERDSHAIDVPRLKPGEKVEVASDPIPGMVLRQARSVVVTIDPFAPAPAARPPRLGQLRSANRYIEERALPTGNLTYSGVVARFGVDKIVLHTRDGREQPLLLRKDTRYLLNGDLVDAAVLKLNTPVFVRAGRDLWDQVEAYQVIWGKILAP